MKSILTAVIVALSFFAGGSMYAQNNSIGLPDAAFETLKRAVTLVDEGMYEAALTDFDSLAGRYPDNYTVQYERLFALYHLQRFDEVVKDAKKLLKHKDASPMIYQMYGNVLDITGKPDEARKVYRSGLKRFPDAGFLYLELGNIDFHSGDYAAALDNYNDGISVSPSFASNYYRGAMICLASEKARVWGLVYAETAILLAPNNDERKADMGGRIRECLRDNIRILAEGDTAKASVTLVKEHNMTVDEKTGKVYLDFQGVFEGCTTAAVTRMTVARESFEATMPQLIELRRGITETYFEATDNLYGNSMYLLPFWKSVIDAGHWDAYNYFIFSDVFPDESSAWIRDNREALNGFIDWYNESPFTLDKTHTVGAGEIYRDYRPLDVAEAFLLQYDLLKPAEGKPTNDDEPEE